jgi:phenylacetyl-CoA:acceptor oxidoreductase
MNGCAAERLGIADGDLVEVRSPLNATRGPAVLCEGIRPDTLLIIGQFEQWATPFAKDFHAPNMNALVPMLLDLTDATGSSADLVKAAVTRIGSAR